MPSLATNELIMDPTDSDVLYAGTHAGLIKTIDGGDTWKVFADTKIGWYFDSLLLDYTSGSTFALYAATNAGLWKYQGTDKYLLQTQPSDWTRIKSGNITGLAQYPDDPDRFLVGTLDPKTSHSQVWRSKPGSAPTSDASWDDLSNGTHNLPTDSQGGMRVAIAPSNSSIMYAGLITAKRPGIDTIPRMWRLFRSSNGGDTWKLRRSQIAGSSYFGYWENWYNAYVVVDPVLPNTVYVGSIQAYRSDDGGTTLNRITNIHDDQHGFTFHPDHPEIIYPVGDGGIFRCTGRGASCTSLNKGLRVTMFYDLALALSDTGRMIGGTQDNGTIRFDGTEVWDMIRGGDGRYCEIDPLDSDVLYSQHQYLASTAKAANGSADPPKWYAAPGLPSEEQYRGDPYLFIHPTDSDLILASGAKIFAHNSATSDWTLCPGCPSWSDIGPSGASGEVHRVTIDPTTNRFYAGLTNGQLWVLESGSWAKVFTHPTGAGVNGIAIDPGDSNRIFLAFAGWGKTYGPHRVWTIERIVSGGSDQQDLVNWKSTNITGNLPLSLALGTGWRHSDMVVVHPGEADTVFVATTQGVYRGRGYQTEGGWVWFWDAFNCQLPWAVVTDLEIHPLSGYLFGATYGRGLWATPLIAPD